VNYVAWTKWRLYFVNYSFSIQITQTCSTDQCPWVPRWHCNGNLQPLEPDASRENARIQETSHRTEMSLQAPSELGRRWTTLLHCQPYELPRLQAFVTHCNSTHNLLWIYKCSYLDVPLLTTMCTEKNTHTHSRSLVYLREKCSDFLKIFRKCLGGNKNSISGKVRYYFLLVMFCWHHISTFVNYAFYYWTQTFNQMFASQQWLWSHKFVHDVSG